DTFAVVIGIDYQNRKDIPHLQYASNDARQVYEVLTDPRYGGVPEENAILLLNEKATRNEMMVAFRKIRDRDGYIYVYYSGHGAPKTKGDQFIDAYLVPDNAIVTDPEALEDTSIKMSYLQKLMDDSHAKGIMVALDACFSGGGKSIVPKGGKPLVGMLISSEIMKPTGAGRVLITSSATNQQSWEDEAEIKGGIFTHYLLEGLMGKGGKDVWVKIDELSDYVKKNVPKASKRLKGQEQYPQITGKGNFAVTRNWNEVKVKDVNIARSRLKTAFEHGNINAKQLSRAMDELKSVNRSKTLEAYLEGKIDEENFGALY
ncbi:MAG: caspase family protein, partial [Proteobacteria bacterium]|nr:caspase family protein [Pseudomonadota bacterium]